MAAVEEHDDQQKTDGDDHREPLLRVLQTFKFAGPRDAIADRQLDILGNELLRFVDRTGKVAVANAELHRNVALSGFVINVRGPGIE